MTFLRLFSLLSLLCFATLALGACSDTRESLGLGRSSPDEFTVVDRPPLAMPPEFGLRPPRPGEPRPQDVDPSVKASDALFGPGTTVAAADAGNASPGEQALLAKTGATKANPNIRNVINAEAAQKTEVSDHLAADLLFWQKPTTTQQSTVVDPAAEAARIKAAQTAGTPLNQGVTPVIERQQSSFLGL